MKELTNIDLDKLANVTGGSAQGDVCRDAYTAVGGWAGAALTSESLGWGAIPGTIIGGAVGRAVCPQ